MSNVTLFPGRDAYYLRQAEELLTERLANTEGLSDTSRAEIRARIVTCIKNGNKHYVSVSYQLPPDLDPEKNPLGKKLVEQIKAATAHAVHEVSNRALEEMINICIDLYRRIDAKA